MISAMFASSSSARSDTGKVSEASTSAGDLISAGSALARLEDSGVEDSGRPLLRLIETRFAAAKVAFAALSVAEAALRVSKSVLARSSMLLKRQDCELRPWQKYRSVNPLGSHKSQDDESR